MTRHIPKSTLFCSLALALASPALAGDVSVQLDAGAGFSLRNSSGAIERLRVDEATGNISRNGALFVHTTGSDNTFVGAGAGNLSTSGYGGNAALGVNALSSNTTGYINVAVGHNALRANTVGHSNSAVGYGALHSNLTGNYNAALGTNALGANTAGSRNIAIGYFTLYHNQGNNNSAVGHGALSSNTTGFDNTAVGRGALFSNTTAYNNTAVGKNALYFNSSVRNSALGADALRANTTGYDNSAVGAGALFSNTVGIGNSAVGGDALRANSTGSMNSALGHRALVSNTTGATNTAIGVYALYGNTLGSNNAALGHRALYNNTTGSNNVAVGVGALHYNDSSERNVAVGYRAGFYHGLGSDNIFIANTSDPSGGNGQIKIGTAGTHTTARIAGIRGVTTGVANAIPVLIDGTGQLGTVSSSLSVKTDIRDMGDATARLLELRPVTFRYREQQQTLPDGGEAPPEYGLVAEEVATVFPDLVVYDDHGKPFTVKYHEMAPMLLNEIKRQQRAHAEEMATLTARLARLEAESRATDR